MSDVVNSFNTEAHYTSDIKVSRPVPTVAEGPAAVPGSHYYSDLEASKRFNILSNDIFEGTKSKIMKKKKDTDVEKVVNNKFDMEKGKYDFNRSLYFKIFGGLTLAVLLIACRNRIRNWFK